MTTNGQSKAMPNYKNSAVLRTAEFLSGVFTMLKTAVIGSNEFIVGFQLAGIKNTVEISSKPFNDIQELKGRKDLGIVIIEETILENLEKHQRVKVEDSVEPVFIPVSAKVEHDSLRRLIKKSVGVDLWK
ncbi:V-type ATP synthase subunit F [Candidatus Woesearchaeota archaeon]|nr:V-type ATP synthase subunit F [Candidatus Woesearchaeota archaeon]